MSALFLKECCFLSPLLVLCSKTFEALPHEYLLRSSNSYLTLLVKPLVFFGVVGESGVVCAAARMLVFASQQVLSVCRAQLQGTETFAR